jgi:hypothetical protein
MLIEQWIGGGGRWHLLPDPFMQVDRQWSLGSHLARRVFAG